MRILPLLALVSVAVSACAPSAPADDAAASASSPAPVAAASKAASSLAKDWSELTEEEWKGRLTAGQYAVLRQNGTEKPFTSELLHEKRAGTYVTADCGEPVFRSEQKYDSGTGWPSFWAPIKPDAVVEAVDDSHGSVRTEIRSRCGGHLGHVFEDGPDPTGLRYCINGLALKFIPDAGQPETTKE